MINLRHKEVYADQDDCEKDDDEDDKDDKQKLLPRRALADLHNIPKGSGYCHPQFTDLDIGLKKVSYFPKNTRVIVGDQCWKPALLLATAFRDPQVDVKRRLYPHIQMQVQNFCNISITRNLQELWLKDSIHVMATDENLSPLR